MLRRYLPELFLILVSMMLLLDPANAQAKLKIAVTLHPYYSWVKNIAGERADVFPLLPAGSDPHSYQPQPDDLQRLLSAHVLISNGLGHDAFLPAMLSAVKPLDLVHIQAGTQSPLIPSFTQNTTSSAQWNSHSFLSITSAIQQISTISQQLQTTDPNNADFYARQTRRYIKKLRTLLAQQLTHLNAGHFTDIKLASVHDAYRYLLQDLGLELDRVIQPRHGLNPSPSQLTDTIRQLQQQNIDILFTELDYGEKFSHVIKQETNINTFQLDHIASGAYTADKFERAMQNNMQTIYSALSQYAR